MVHGDGQIIGNGTTVIEGSIVKQEDAGDLLLLNISLAYRSPGKFRGIFFALRPCLSRHQAGFSIFYRNITHPIVCVKLF